jgi:hypothetical protein
VCPRESQRELTALQERKRGKWILEEASVFALWGSSSSEPLWANGPFSLSSVVFSVSFFLREMNLLCSAGSQDLGRPLGSGFPLFKRSTQSHERRKKDEAYLNG